MNYIFSVFEQFSTKGFTCGTWFHEAEGSKGEKFLLKLIKKKPKSPVFLKIWVSEISPTRFCKNPSVKTCFWVSKISLRSSFGSLLHARVANRRADMEVCFRTISKSREGREFIRILQNIAYNCIKILHFLLWVGKLAKI